MTVVGGREGGERAAVVHGDPLAFLPVVFCLSRLMIRGVLILSTFLPHYPHLFFGFIVFFTFLFHLRMMSFLGVGNAGEGKGKGRERWK